MRKTIARQRWWIRLFGAAVRCVGIAPAPHDLRRAVERDWRTDTGAMGVRFTERLRDIFRRRWLRLRK
jgi:hypothetical protein